MLDGGIDALDIWERLETPVATCRKRTLSLVGAALTTSLEKRDTHTRWGEEKRKAYWTSQ